MRPRLRRRVVNLGGVPIGGEHPVVVQSMCSTDTRDVEATVAQIGRLQQAGCEVVRVAVVDMEAAAAIAAIRPRIGIPLVADIHFDHRLALASLAAGADGLRLNPGNIGGRDKVREVVAAARDRGVPIRVGVNAGSLDKALLERYGGPCAEAMVESALEHVAILEDMDFRDIKVSLKASSIPVTLAAYRMMAARCDYPLHLGVTEAGTRERGLIKSALGIGILLEEGIGDTIRVSLTADPEEEVWAAYQVLAGLGLRQRGPELISCPTCGRTEIDLIPIAEEVDRRLRGLAVPLKVAVMGCVVNGPGEAREADVGIAGGRGFGLLFKKGEIVGRVEESRLVDALMQEIEEMTS
ncbi:MAG: flavodoxin-dependent (E)-4-hydroxy-3-methylbut-2-enyl-diphosphate synthase [Syntrophomonadaceae bacterium]|nr:flavodoxin-dependent (E)-4-hydroxy-3-methylbut-2-enyl-diphosphate synthase [Syntrophomonadaceae bacterium]MDH7497443.1 flavodoxin-dependent (E)-4-hydroxy-3-methylbut-2-enyl-diphosphate synthase [Syntrophomonadaceae bacterium]